MNNLPFVFCHVLLILFEFLLLKISLKIFVKLLVKLNFSLHACLVIILKTKFVPFLSMFGQVGIFGSFLYK